MRRRKLFELKNPPLSSLPACSLWLHVSSEGELEQALPVLTSYLEEVTRDDHVLLLITSPSVERGAEKLCEQHSRLHFLRLPLVTDRPLLGSSLWSLPAPQFFCMVRYDFFPLLLAIAEKRQTYSILLNATVKNKKLSPWFVWGISAVYHKFDAIYWSCSSDLKSLRGSDFSLRPEQLQVADFRHQNIIDRQEKQFNLKALGQDFEVLKETIATYPYDRRLILGSVWAWELEQLKPMLYKLAQEGFFVLLAPHQLAGREADRIKELFSRASLWQEKNSLRPSPLVVSFLPRLLCELYPLFGHCYVGGGFARSVHSLLEPYWGGGHLYCGPRVHRSTEYDYILEQNPERLTIVKELSTFERQVTSNCGLKSVDLLHEKRRIKELYQPRAIFLAGGQVKSEAFSC